MTQRHHGFAGLFEEQGGGLGGVGRVRLVPRRYFAPLTGRMGLAVTALGLGLQSRLGGQALAWWDQVGCTLWGCQGMEDHDGCECLCTARDSGRAGEAIRGALSSPSPAGLPGPPWGWSKLIPSPLLGLPIRRQQKSVPTWAARRRQDFYPTLGTRVSPKCPSTQETTCPAEMLGMTQLSLNSSRGLSLYSWRSRRSGRLLEAVPAQQTAGSL